MDGLKVVLRRHPLQFEDVWDLPPYDKIPKLHASFQEHWDAQLPRGQPSLVRPGLKCSLYG